jgi:hypothetical protein
MNVYEFVVWGVYVWVGKFICCWIMLQEICLNGEILGLGL